MRSFPSSNGQRLPLSHIHARTHTSKSPKTIGGGGGGGTGDDGGAGERKEAATLLTVKTPSTLGAPLRRLPFSLQKGNRSPRLDPALFLRMGHSASSMGFPQPLPRCSPPRHLKRGARFMSCPSVSPHHHHLRLRRKQMQPWRSGGEARKKNKKPLPPPSLGPFHAHPSPPPPLPKGFPSPATPSRFAGPISFFLPAALRG